MTSGQHVESVIWSVNCGFFFQLLPYSRDVATAGGSAYFIWQIYMLENTIKDCKLQALQLGVERSQMQDTEADIVNRETSLTLIVQKHKIIVIIITLFV